MAGLSAQDELLLLRKRARRRLVGAVVLVLIATAVLWKILGKPPVQSIQPDSVEVAARPGDQQNSGGQPSRTASAPQEASRPDAVAPPEIQASAPVTSATAAKKTADNPPPPQATAPAHGAPAPSPPLKADDQPARVETPPSVVPPRHVVDPAAILEGRTDSVDTPPAAAPAPAADSGKFILQLAALSDATKAEALKAKLAELGVDARFSKVQTSKGTVTRVRAGPFTSRAAATAVLNKLEHAGVSGIVMEQ